VFVTFWKNTFAIKRPKKNWSHCLPESILSNSVFFIFRFSVKNLSIFKIRTKSIYCEMGKLSSKIGSSLKSNRPIRCLKQRSFMNIKKYLKMLTMSSPHLELLLTFFCFPFFRNSMKKAFWFRVTFVPTFLFDWQNITKRKIGKVL